MSLQLPYPGFTWSLSQHMGPVTQSSAVFELLQAAFVYGKDEDANDKITEYIISQNLLTANVRQDAGRPQTWRDYQQVLAELGLIISSRYTQGVQLTPIGLMYLDGLIGYSELLTTQALSYQYPNGHKRDLSTRQRQELHLGGFSIPATRIELDANHGILVKPAVLMLRILLELTKYDEQAQKLTVDECLSCLAPIQRNNQWQVALNELMNFRLSSQRVLDQRRRRHVQEWFRLLSLTDIFETMGDTIQLSSRAIENFDLTLQLCEHHEDLSTFWIPTDFTDIPKLALSWYATYGNPELLSQWNLPQTDTQYIEENYPQLEDTEENELPQVARERNAEVRLQPFSPNRNRQYSNSATSEYSAEDRVRANERQQKSSRLHEEIVVLIANKLEQAGYQVQEDPSSVDLLATRDDRHTIIEVKTVNRRNVDQRVRGGVGQLLEYRYRIQKQLNSRPSGVLVLSSNANFADWIRDYFETDIQLGLVGLANSQQFQSYTTGEIETLLIAPNGV